MTEKEALNKLTDLLNLLKAQKNAVSFNKILELTNKDGLGFDGKLLKIALYRLMEDRYVYELENEDVKGDIIYSITIQGTIFHGYAEQKRIDEEKRDIIAGNESRKLTNDYRLIVGTYLAGIVGVLLLLWQVFLYLYPKQSDFYYFWWQTIPKK